MESELVVRTRAEVGEGPIWDPGTETLVWVDITGSAVHRFDPATGRDECMDVGIDVGAVAVRASGGLVMAAADGFRSLEADGSQMVLAEVEADDPTMRMNDGKCDRHGRFWAGTMAYDEAAPAGLGKLYRLDPDLSVRVMVDGVSISNGIDWSPNDRLMYYIDSPTRRVDVFDFDLDDGAISNRRTLIEVDASLGFPDGMTVDANGDLWVAVWGGSRRGALRAGRERARHGAVSGEPDVKLCVWRSRRARPVRDLGGAGNLRGFGAGGRELVSGSAGGGRAGAEQL